MKPRSPGLFSILSLMVWQNPLLSSLLASVCFWRICTLYGNNFKSLWMILCTVVLKMPTSWDSRRVDYRGDCSRCFFSAWTLARVLTATHHPLWPLLTFPTLPVFLNFSTIFVIVFLHGVSQEIPCETQLSKIFGLLCTENWTATSILVSNNFYRSCLQYLWK